MYRLRISSRKIRFSREQIFGRVIATSRQRHRDVVWESSMTQGSVKATANLQAYAGSRTISAAHSSLLVRARAKRFLSLLFEPNQRPKVVGNSTYVCIRQPSAPIERQKAKPICLGFSSLRRNNKLFYRDKKRVCKSDVELECVKFSRLCFLIISSTWSYMKKKKKWLKHRNNNTLARNVNIAASRRDLCLTYTRRLIKRCLL